MKLNLGCGANRIKGFINIDAAKGEYANPDMKADKYCDILDLVYEPNTIEAIRMESVFEHFPRHIALFLSRRLYTWLKPGGFLSITVPDLMGTIDKIKSTSSICDQLFYFRHIFGPQDVLEYGTHYDGFTIEKLELTFKAAGFNDFKAVKKGRWPSIYFTAFKRVPFVDDEEAKTRIITLLRHYTKGRKANFLMDAWLAQCNKTNVDNIHD